MAEEQQDLATIPVVYTNNVRLQMTFTDFKVYFGEVLPVGPPTNTLQPIVATQQKTVDRVCIVISPDIIPSLIAGLTQGIEMYQQQFGPLRKPPQQPQHPPRQPALSSPD
jgi:hypothetical protein